MTADAFQRSITGLLRTVPDIRITNRGAFGRSELEIVLAGPDADGAYRDRAASGGALVFARTRRPAAAGEA